ncbi:uncharacterized protein LOC62_01G000068 [Vanrija pseudolonga]|uniref:Uncharacterized protein n=1 Tax=Vanrija pseudolonga TaxID=143232 RepID=A0AAF0Y2I8_9TREE|nr:hypothetical protein LOC62_01G000068 [Vanrija pseudolonga]
MLVKSLLTVALAAPTVIGAWGDWCYTKVTAHGGKVFPFNGVCVGTSECHRAYGETVGKPVPGACPGNAPGIECCYAEGCYPIKHGRCPGGDDVKCKADVGDCWIMASGACPGGDNFRAAMFPYKRNGVVVKCSNVPL